jgi:hypothetical protein
MSMTGHGRGRRRQGRRGSAGQDAARLRVLGGTPLLGVPLQSAQQANAVA